MFLCLSKLAFASYTNFETVSETELRYWSSTRRFQYGTVSKCRVSQRHDCTVSNCFHHCLLCQSKNIRIIVCISNAIITLTSKYFTLEAFLYTNTIRNTFECHCVYMKEQQTNERANEFWKMRNIGKARRQPTGKLLNKTIAILTDMPMFDVYIAFWGAFLLLFCIPFVGVQPLCPICVGISVRSFVVVHSWKPIFNPFHLCRLISFHLPEK